MILLAALLAAQAVPTPSAPDDVVVIGQRLERIRRLRMTTKLDRKTGVTRCIFKRRSGDPALDTAMCDAVLACVPKVKAMDEMRGCLAPTMANLVAKEATWQAAKTKVGR